MARREVIQLTDDLDGSEATRTIRFGFEGVDYEIDLNEENADEMSKWLENYIAHGRRVGGRKNFSSSNGPARTRVDPKAVREWAHANGIDVSTRGRIPSQLVVQFQEATSRG